MNELAHEDIGAIARIHKHWIDNELAGTSAEMLRFCTEDVMWIPPDSPVLVGEDALPLLEDPEIRVQEISFSHLRIHGSGSVAYLTSNYATKYLVRGSPKLFNSRGTHLWILHKADEGPWKIAVITWSTLGATEAAADD